MITFSFSAFSQQRDADTFNNLHVDTGQVRLIYLGTAGWEITDGRTSILIDPYLSRIHINIPRSIGSAAAEMQGDTRPVIGPNDLVVSDTSIINAHIKRVDYILVHHSHFDHVMDVPFIARKTGAAVIGHESTTNLMRAYGIGEDQLITVRGGEDYDFGTFSVKVIPSLHSPLFQKHYYDSHIIPPDIKTPVRLVDFVEGGSLAYLIRFDGYQILTFGSMNYIERELEGLRPDVALIGAGPSRKEIHDYAGRLMRVLGFPAIIIPTHWDNYILPYQSSQEDQVEKLDSFIREVKTASPNPT
jgi:L-ascorbate metabolism protein UlaG (beta-lactamase superfamily)